MNPRISTLHKQRDAAKAEAQQIVELAESEDRDLTDEEKSQLSALKAQAESLQERADRIQELFTPNGKEKPVDGLQIGEPTATRIEPQGPVIEKDPKRGFETLGDFASSVFRTSQPGAVRDDRLTIGAIQGHGQVTGSDGGFLVPPQFSTAIWDALNQSPDNLLARTDSYPVTGDSLTFNANAETSRATGSRYGGIRAYWIAEGAQMTASKVKLRQMKLEPQQMAVFAYVTDKLLNNAPALDAYLTRAAVDEINFTVGDAIINGDGVGKPLGVLNSGAVVDVDKETGQAAASLVTENIVKMWARCHPVARRNAVWFYNQSIEPVLFLLSQNVGTGGMPVYMPPGGLSAAPYGAIFGRPAVPIEYAQELGTKGDLMLLDLAYYATGTAGGISSDASIHLRFDYNETAFRFLFAVDGRPWLVSPITPYKGSTLSPFVVLKARS